MECELVTVLWVVSFLRLSLITGLEHGKWNGKWIGMWD